MKVLKPQPLKILNDSVPEDEAPLWDAAATYATGEQVIYNHCLYTALAENSNAVPDVSTIGEDAAWRFLDATNKYKCIDAKNHTQTIAPEGVTELVIEVPFERPANAVGLLNMDALSVAVGLKDDEGNFIWGGEELRVTLQADSDSWWVYCFGGFTFRRDLTTPDIPRQSAVLEALAPASGTLWISLKGPRPAVGNILVGGIYDLGMTQYGVSLGLNDKSVDREDEYGNVTLIKRHTAKTGVFPIVFHRNYLDIFMRLQAELAGSFALWIGDDAMEYDCMTIYGWAKLTDTNLDGPEEVNATIETLGIV
jgi:hypothetical protein